jgi:hypothetical protein
MVEKKELNIGVGNRYDLRWWWESIAPIEMPIRPKSREAILKIM